MTTDQSNDVIHDSFNSMRFTLVKVKRQPIFFLKLSIVYKLFLFLKSNLRKGIKSTESFIHRPKFVSVQKIGGERATHF